MEAKVFGRMSVARTELFFSYRRELRGDTFIPPPSSFPHRVPSHTKSAVQVRLRPPAKKRRSFSFLLSSVESNPFKYTTQHTPITDTVAYLPAGYVCYIILISSSADDSLIIAGADSP
eukprot:gene7708-5407_t